MFTVNNFSVFIVNFEQLNADWDMKLLHIRRRADSNAELSFLRVSFYFILFLCGLIFQRSIWKVISASQFDKFSKNKTL